MAINNDNKYYYESDKIVAFPSANSKDSGKLTSEENLRDITTRITECNYRLDTNSFNVTVNIVTIDNEEKLEIKISPGSANIAGYKISTTNEAIIYLPIKEIENIDNFKLYLYISMRKDSGSTDNIHGDEYDTSSNTNIFLGAYIGYTDNYNEDYFKDKLYLGKITGKTQPHFTINPFIDCRVDPSNIYINFTGTDKYEYGDELHTNETIDDCHSNYYGIYNLKDFVNMTDLAYVSRYGDLICGNLLFSSKEISPTTDHNYNIKIGGEINVAGNNRDGITYCTYNSDKYYAYIEPQTITLGKDPELYGSNAYIRYDCNDATGEEKLSIAIDQGLSNLSSPKMTFHFHENKSEYTGIDLNSGSGKLHIKTNMNIPVYYYNNDEDYLSSQISTVYAGNISIGDHRFDNSTPGSNYKDISKFLEINPAFYRRNINSKKSYYYPKINYCNDAIQLDYKANCDKALIQSNDGVFVDKLKFYGTNKSNEFDIDNTADIYILNIDNSDDVHSNKYVLKIDNKDISVSNNIISNKGLILCEDDNYESHITKEDISQDKCYIRCIGTSADIINTGFIEATGIIKGAKVYNAVYNDYADFIKKDKSNEYEPGDIIAKKPNSDEYTLATYDNRKLVVGVYSDNYGHILGGENLKNMEDNKENYIPLGVAGNVDVKIIGNITEGDLITISEIPGVGKKVDNIISSIGCIVGKALENKTYNEIGKVKMQIMLM